MTRQVESIIKFVETKRPGECDYNEMVKVIRKFEIASYLLSAFVFSLSSQALIKANLFSVVTCASKASEKTYDKSHLSIS
jgi:hypothetical protein